MKRLCELFVFNLKQATKLVLLIACLAILCAIYFVIFHWIFVTVQSLYGMAWAVVALIVAVIIMSTLGATIVEYVFERLGIK